MNRIFSFGDLFLNNTKRYWGNGRHYIENLPIVEVSFLDTSFPPALKKIALPIWASDLGVEGYILVPEWSVLESNIDEWESTDWLSAGFWMVNCLAEQEYENQNGPIHSYSYKLKGWDSQLWERAWANRIALFLRRWAAQVNKRSETELFGELPDANIIISHDVDAVKKTLPIRLKQCAFSLFNSLRSMGHGEFLLAKRNIGKAFTYLLSNDNYWCFQAIKQLENTYNLRSTFLFYSAESVKLPSLKRWIFDPKYDITENRIAEEIALLNRQGWTVGLHQSFCAWKEVDRMENEKIRLEQILKEKITICRQHWLRFSWEHTWKAQKSSGLNLDMTLGFNDRCGFRNSAALKFEPYHLKDNCVINIETVPMILMDSHLYDYSLINSYERIQRVKHIIDEVFFVRGEASIIWHQHTMSKDYGWSEGYKELLNIITKGILI